MTLPRLSILTAGALWAGAIAAPVAFAGPPPAAASPATPAPSPPVAPAASTAAPVTPTTPNAPPHAAPAKRRPHVEEAPALPLAELRLTLDVPSPEGPWTVRIENAGAVPLRVLADPRLLAFEITLPSAEADGLGHHRVRAARPIRCELPSDMRPADYEERALVIPAGRRFVEKVDPRLFCFGRRAAAGLVPGATVLPRLLGSRESPAVAPIEEVEPKVAGARDWIGTTATLPSPAAAPGTAGGATQPVAVSSPAFVDFGVGWEAEIATTVRNTSRQSVALLLRPETVGFDVTGPSGLGVTDPSPTVRCHWPGPPPEPIAETYTHLGAKQTASIAVLLSAVCPEGALHRPGLYLVRPRLDTQRASGASVGVRTFTGEVVSSGVTRLRVRESSGPAAPASRPTLEPVAPSEH